MKNTVSTFLSMKQNGERLTEITSYDYTTAKLVEKAGINAILVGDSLGMTMMGYDTTLPVTMEDMIHHSACVVRECVPPKLAALISKKLTIPTIGIGAGAGCDGQVLVYQDMLGMNMDFTPKFAKQFDNIGERMVDAFRAYMNEVQNGTFPTEKQSFVKSDCSDEYLAKLDAEF